MLVLYWEVHCFAFCVQFNFGQFQEVYIWWESSQKIQNVVTAIIPDDTLAFDGRAQLNLFFFIVKDLEY